MSSHFAAKNDSTLTASGQAETTKGTDNKGKEMVAEGADTILVPVVTVSIFLLAAMLKVDTVLKSAGATD